MRRYMMSAALTQVAVLAAVTVTWTASAQAKVWSNTQIRLPDNAYLGDINGDGSTDFVYVRGGAIYVTNSDPDNTKILYSMLTPSWPIARVFTGDFQGVGADQICALHVNGMLTCWAISPDRTGMWWWFTETNFIGADEHVIVGDFDADDRDDILIYKPSTGQIRHFVNQGGFVENPSFWLGNLDPANLVNKQIYAGEFGQSADQTDLLVYDPANGQLVRFDSVSGDGVNPTFWWAFTTSPGFVSPDEVVAVANIDGLGQDNLVLRDQVQGTYRFFRLEPDWYASDLVHINQDPGQLPGGDQYGGSYWLRNRGWDDWWSNRDDNMYYDAESRTWVNTHARVWNGAQYYWWYYAKAALRHLEGDANGDQRTDLAVLGNQRWSTMPLATSNGDGTFNETNLANSDPGTNFPAWAAAPGAKLVRGDFDGDGLSDMALVGGKGWGSIPVAFSRGDGTYHVTNQSVADFPAWASRPNVKAVAGDFNGDTRTDIALVGEVGRHTIPVALSLSDGTFVVLDVAQSSFADLASSRDFNRNPQVWPKVVAADFNNDGACDLALVGGVDFTGVPVALGSGWGTLSFQYQNLAGGASNVAAFHDRAREPGTYALAGDFDGNGIPDIALVGGSGRQTDISFALNYGGGQFFAGASVQAPEISQWAEEPGVKVVSGYFNDDALADIALVGGLGWTTVRLALSNDGGLSFHATNAASTFGGYAAEPHVWPAASVASNAGRTARSLDQDGDRRGDISLAGGVGWSTMPVGFSRGDGDFKVTNNGIDAQWTSFAAHSGVSVLAGDYDGDGKEDVALTTTSGFPRMVAFANGNGTFRVTANGTTPGSPTNTRVVAGDFNGDGMTDIIAIGGYDSVNNRSLNTTLHQSYGDGTFLHYSPVLGAELAGYVNNPVCCVQIVAGDYNGDGASDLAVLGGPASADDTVHVYLSTGGLGDFRHWFFKNTGFRSQIGAGSNVAAGDFDGDGMDDLYFLKGSGTGTNVMVGLSHGTGEFTAVSLPAPNASSSMMAMTGNFVEWSRSFYERPVVGDFDGDGASDIALVGGRGWSSVPIAFSNRRTDVTPWIVHNPPVKDFPVYAAMTGALAAAEDPTNTVDPVAPPPPAPDPPSSMPTQTDVYVQGRYIDMPRNQPVVYYNAGWTFEFSICNDNNDDFDLPIGRTMVRETFVGEGNQWHIYDWWAKGTEVRDNGTAGDYRSVDYLYGDSYPLPDTDYTRQPYKLFEIIARGCKRMYWERPGGQGPGIYYYEVYIDDVDPPTNEGHPNATILLSCPQSSSFQCLVTRQ